ncbi:hypothetical protein Tco_0465944 [Tanacetum coccineum]
MFSTCQKCLVTVKATLLPQQPPLQTPGNKMTMTVGTVRTPNHNGTILQLSSKILWPVPLSYAARSLSITELMQYSPALYEDLTIGPDATYRNTCAVKI